MSAPVSLDRIAAATPSPTAPSVGAPRPFADAVSRAVASIDASAPAPSVDASLDAAQALELQAAVYRHAERIELTSKIVDLGVGAIRTLLQTRV